MLADSAVAGETGPCWSATRSAAGSPCSSPPTAPELVRGIVLTGVPLLRPQTAAAKPPFGFRALRLLNKWHFISNDRMERERRKRGSADYVAAQGVMREVLVKAVNEDYGDELDAARADRAAGRDGVGRARHRGAGAHGGARPRSGSARPPTSVVVPGSAHLLDAGAGRGAAQPRSTGQAALP